MSQEFSIFSRIHASFEYRGKPTRNLCSSLFSAPWKLHSTFQIFLSIFPWFEAKFCTVMSFFYIFHLLGTTQSHTQQQTLVLNKMILNSDMLQPCSMQEMTEQTVLCMYLVAETHTSGCSVILWPVWKLIWLYHVNISTWAVLASRHF